ncbi:MAG: PilZ domain-containing protein [Sphingomicrobium sp.]
MQLEAAVARSDGSVVESRVSDLSLEGCCLTGSFPIGELIQVTIPRVGTHVAQIRWSFMDRSGARFISAVSQTPGRQVESVGSGGGT